MADSVDRVFGHALNTVNKIRPGSQKPPAADRLALYGLYKQSMEGDVALVADRPAAASEHTRKEQEKWDAWKGNEGLSRTEAKRRYIERLIATMHAYASTTAEARELVEELEFVWDQIKSNSVQASSGSEEGGSPVRRSGRDLVGSSSGGGVGMSSSAAALEAGRDAPMRVLSPVSQQEEEGEMITQEEREEFVDAPVSQVDEGELQDISGSEGMVADAGVQAAEPTIPPPFHQPRSSTADVKWRRRIEGGLIKLTTEVAALREQLDAARYNRSRNRHTLLGWILRLSWWAVQLVVADAVILWIVILYMRRKDDRRIEGAVRVLLGDAVAQVQRVTGREVRIPALAAKIGGKKGN